MTINRSRSMKTWAARTLAAAVMFVLGASTPAESQILRLPTDVNWPSLQWPGLPWPVGLQWPGQPYPTTVRLRPRPAPAPPPAPAPAPARTAAPDPPNQSQLPPRVQTEINLSGPRFGLTMLGEKHMQALREKEIFLERPVVSQFGWQFERRLYTSDDGVTALMEVVPLLSGLEQGVAIPSFNWLAGVRTATGTEFGIGPNLTPAGVGLVIAAGVTIRQGALNIPLNFAVVSSKSGPRVSIMTGFNIRR